MSKNCYNCKFNAGERNLPRLGEQVKCAKAEELFGGERWVDVRKSEKTGKLLNSKCGTYEHFLGDQLLPEKPPEKPKAKLRCTRCNGTGSVQIRVVDRNERSQCFKCDGKGTVEQQ